MYKVILYIYIHISQIMICNCTQFWRSPSTISIKLVACQAQYPECNTIACNLYTWKYCTELQTLEYKETQISSINKNKCNEKAQNHPQYKAVIVMWCACQVLWDYLLYSLPPSLKHTHALFHTFSLKQSHSHSHSVSCFSLTLSVTPLVNWSMFTCIQSFTSRSRDWLRFV